MSSFQRKVLSTLRLPNPPPVFAGRERETSRLVELVERGNVSCVLGAAGIGKTALALHTLHGAFARRVDRTLYVRFPEHRGTQPPLAVDRLVLAALQGSPGAPGTERARVRTGRRVSLAHDRDARALAALDLLEKHGLWLVLDDWHHAEPVENARWLALAVRYARGVRILVTNRGALPDCIPFEQQLILPPLASSALVELAGACAPHLDEVTRATLATRANGSPAALRALVRAALEQGGLPHASCEQTDDGPGAARRHEPRDVQAWRAAMCGDFTSTFKQLDGAREEDAPAQSAFLLAGRCLHDLHAGNIDSARRLTLELSEHPVAPSVASRIEWLAHEVAVAAGDDSCPPIMAQPAAWSGTASLRAARLRGEIHAPTSSDDSFFARCEGEQLRAVHALLSGQSGRAVAHARLAERVARVHGLHLHHVTSVALQCELLVCVGDKPALRSAAALLSALARTAKSPRWTAEAELFALLADETPPDALRLEALAGLDREAPQAARRARALLGESVWLDHVERRMIARARDGATWRITTRMPAPSAKRGWGRDRVQERLWLEDGRVVDISKRPLTCKLLDVLTESASPKSVEELARRAWSIRTFNPLRDAKRVHTALYRLRVLIEPDARSPTHVVTNANGSYALSENVPFRVLERMRPRAPALLTGAG